jgi:hypothetical protein
MEFIAAGPNLAAKMETLLEQNHCLPLGALICFVFAYETLDLVSQEGTDGSRTLGRENPGFPDRLAIEADGEIPFFVFFHRPIVGFILSRASRIAHSFCAALPALARGKQSTLAGRALG